jgi:ribosomal protein S18 acetylase RimI-like enzyme
VDISFLKSRETKQRLDIEVLSNAVSSARDSLENVKELAEVEPDKAIIKIQETCVNLINTFEGLYSRPPAIIEEVGKLSCICNSLNVKADPVLIKKTIHGIQDTCMWLDLTYDLQKYPTYLHSLRERDKAIQLPPHAELDKESLGARTLLEVTLRPIRFGDLPLIRDIELTHFEFPEAPGELTGFYNLGAEHESKLAGYLFYSAHRPELFAMIESIAVTHEKIGRGIGSKMLGFIESELARLEWREIRAWVRESNHTAIDFFQKNEYWEKRSEEYPNIKVKERAILFAKNIESD